MNLFAWFRDRAAAEIAALAASGVLPQGFDTSRIGVELPRDPTHGDLACNAALVMAGRQSGARGSLRSCWRSGCSQSMASRRRK